MARDVRWLKTLSEPLLVAGGLAWLVACLWFPLTDTDIWWHLASAKLMWATRAFLRQDPFCQSSLGAPWADLHWGFQILAYAAWKLGGAQALVAGKCLAVAGALGFALKPHLDRRTLPWLIPMAAFGLYQVRFFIDVRPLAPTLLCLGLQYFAVTSYWRGGLRRPWLILLPVQAVMVNLQGLYPLGALLVTCLTVGEYAGRRWSAWFASAQGALVQNASVESPSERDLAVSGAFMGERRPLRPLRPLIWTCSALWLSGFLSPYGMHGFALPLSLLARIAPVGTNIFSSEIAENLPLSELLRRDAGAGLPFVALGLIFAFGFFRAGRRPSLGHALLLMAFACLGWMAQRNLPLFLLAGLMAAGRNLQVYLGEGDERARDSGFPKRGFGTWAGLAALSAVAVLYGPRIRAAWAYELPGRLETPFRFPVAAVDYLERNPLSGNIFNELRYGGYLEYRLHPGTLSFVDGRMILRSAEFYRDFLEAVDEPERFEAYRARYGFTHALLPISEDQRFLPLAAHLIRGLGWRLLYCDGASALLADPVILSDRKAGLELDSLDSGHPLATALRQRFSANPRLESIAILNAVRFLRAAGHERAAADLARP